MLKLSPVEYKFATEPLSSEGSDYLKLTLQHLCLKDVIRIEQRWILIHPRDRRRRRRFFFSRGQQFERYSSTKMGERFVLQLFDQNEEFRFYVLRQYIKNHFGREGTDCFKTDYVMNDLARSKLTFFKYFPARELKKAAKEITSELKFLDDSVDRLITNDQERLHEFLQSLETNILFLKPETLEKLNTISDEILKIENMQFFAIMNTSFSVMDSFFYGDLDGFDSMDMSDVGGFGGFDGGDFGGGGAGGDW